MNHLIQYINNVGSVFKFEKKFISLKAKSIYLAPANPKSKALSIALAEQNVEVLGFIDNLKIGDGIYNKPEELKSYDYIVVTEGAYQKTICQTLILRGFNAKTILVTQQDNFIVYNNNWLVRIKNSTINICKYIINFAITIIQKVTPTSKTIYYTEDFIDNNILVAWQYHGSVSKNEVLLVAKNLKPIRGNKLPILSADSWRGTLALIRAKCIIVDHEYNGEIFNAIRRRKPFIQLYHGLPYKFLAGNKHFKHIHDYAFISSSAYFNEFIFPKLFSAKNFLTLGYPRNDVFFQTPAERCWINTPETQKPQDIIKKTGPLWVYMPTFRDNGAFTMPFSLAEMQALCEKEHRSLILKFHPFVAKQVVQMFELEDVEVNVVALTGYPNIYLYPPRMNIYPWLADAEILITDYSSVAFDFLLADKPMVFFQYDYDSYYQNRGAFTVPIEDFAAGPVVRSEVKLFSTLAQIAKGGADIDQSKRAKLLAKLNIIAEHACPLLVTVTREVK